MRLGRPLHAAAHEFVVCSLRCGTRPPGPRHKPVAARYAVRAARLSVVGSINVDTVLKLDRLPEAGETIAAHGIQQFPGGKVCTSGVLQ